MTRAYFFATPGWMRLLALILGIAMLLWLPIEDVSGDSVLLFAALISSWLVLRYLLAVVPGERNFLVRHLLAGALAGLAISPLALFLMALKTGLHGHSTPDFTPLQMQSVLFRTLIWVVVGLLFGLGAASFRLALARD